MTGFRKLVTLTFCFLIIILSVNADAKEFYKVKKGDSLYKLSKRFHVSMDEIRQINKLDDKNLKPGMKLLIPSSEKKATTKDTERVQKGKIKARETKMVRVTEPELDAGDSRFHIVRKGDTLSKIAKKYNVSTSELQEINDLRSNKLKIGQKILVKRIGPRTYIVKKGDNIWKIAKRFDLDAEEIMELNELESDELRPGQKLVLEAWIDEKDQKRYETAISELKISDVIKTSSDPDIVNLGVKDRVVLFAKKMLNIPYRFGGSSFMGIDCSAYVQKVFGFLNIPLPRSAREQFTVGQSVDKEELNIGDLVFFKTYASFPSHVGIYLGNNLFIHASSRSKKVTIDNLETPYYMKRFIGARRIISDENSDGAIVAND